MQASLPQHLYHKLRDLAVQQEKSIEQVLETLIENHQQIHHDSDVQAFASLSDDPIFYHSLLRSIGEGIIVYDESGKIIFTNPSAERILGLSTSQMRGLTPSDPGWGAIYPDGSPFPVEKYPVNVALRSQQDQTNIVMGINKPDQSVTWAVAS